jgi:hypothetical protein
MRIRIAPLTLAMAAAPAVVAIPSTPPAQVADEAKIAPRDLDNDGHGFQNEKNHFDFYEAMDKFLAKYLQKG